MKKTRLVLGTCLLAVAWYGLFTSHALFAVVCAILSLLVIP